MSDLDSLLWFPEDSPPTRNGAKGRTCQRHRWVWRNRAAMQAGEPQDRCGRCGVIRDPVVSRRGRRSRKRGVSDELAVARILGGRKVGPLGLPWDVEVEGYLRVQCKKLARWPSLNEVIAWLDAIPQEPELRSVTLADAPGGGTRTRRLIILDLDEFADWHGRR